MTQIGRRPSREARDTAADGAECVCITAAGGRNADATSDLMRCDIGKWQHDGGIVRFDRINP